MKSSAIICTILLSMQLTTCSGENSPYRVASSALRPIQRNQAGQQSRGPALASGGPGSSSQLPPYYAASGAYPAAPVQPSPLVQPPSPSVQSSYGQSAPGQFSPPSQSSAPVQPSPPAQVLPPVQPSPAKPSLPDHYSPSSQSSPNDQSSSQSYRPAQPAPIAQPSVPTQSAPDHPYPVESSSPIQSPPAAQASPPVNPPPPQSQSSSAIPAAFSGAKKSLGHVDLDLLKKFDDYLFDSLEQVYYKLTYAFKDASRRTLTKCGCDPGAEPLSSNHLASPTL